MVGGQGYQLSAEQQLAAAKPKAFKVASLKGRQPKALGLGLGVVRPRGAEPQVRPFTDPFSLRKKRSGSHEGMYRRRGERVGRKGPSLPSRKRRQVVVMMVVWMAGR